MSIPGISHTLSEEIKTSLAGLQFDLEQWDNNPRIGGLLSKTVLNGGKRLRPLLTLLIADIFGVNHKDIAPFARVVELVHAATLAHDDVIDDADTRRGNPSINATSSNKEAVLAGDYLLAHSLSEVAKYRRPALVSCLAEIISDLAEGEWLQIENSTNPALTEAHVEQVALKKTGSVLRWCSQAAPLYLESDSETVALAREFGEQLGIAFQMTDDILDFKRRDGAEFADLKNKVINSVIFKNLSLAQNSATINVAAITTVEVQKDYLEQAMSDVRQQVETKLGRCKEILLELVQRPLEENRHGKRNEAFFTLTCIIEYLANRV